MVYSVALASLPPGEADDVVQETFLRALQQIRSLRDPDAFGGWVAAIARNTATTALRGAHGGAVAGEEPAIEGTQHEAMEARTVLAAIRSLPRAYRRPMLMRLLRGMTGPEIAARTGLTPASVRVNLHRGLALLRDRLDNGPARPRRTETRRINRAPAPPQRESPPSCTARGRPARVRVHGARAPRRRRGADAGRRMNRRMRKRAKPGGGEERLRAATAHVRGPRRV